MFDFIENNMQVMIDLFQTAAIVIVALLLIAHMNKGMIP